MSTIAQISDLQNVFPSSQWGPRITNAMAQFALDAEEDDALSRLRARYSIPNPPVGPFPPKLVQAIVYKARFSLLVTRGYNPANAADVLYERASKSADAWLDTVERQAIHPLIVETGPSPAIAAPMVIGRPSQGWVPPPTETDPCTGLPVSGVRSS